MRQAVRRCKIFASRPYHWTVTRRYVSASAKTGVYGNAEARPRTQVEGEGGGSFVWGSKQRAGYLNETGDVGNEIRHP